MDVFECLSALIIFSGEQMATKIEFLFKIFDFDENGFLTKDELVMTLQASIRGMCKIVNIPAPELAVIEKTTDDIFYWIDEDGNKKIELHEFVKWMENNYALQDFILKYTGTQSYGNANRRYKVLQEKYNLIFKQCTPKSEVFLKKDVEVEVLKKHFLGSYFLHKMENKKALVDFLGDLLVKTTWNSDHVKYEKTNTMVNYQVFQEVMKIWCAFSASDINNDFLLNAKELRMLLYVYEEDCPSNFRLNHAMEDMDSDNSGQINMLEWMKHVAKEFEQGIHLFSKDLQHAFLRHDIDQSGGLSFKELCALLTA